MGSDRDWVVIGPKNKERSGKSIWRERAGELGAACQRMGQCGPGYWESSAGERGGWAGEMMWRVGELESFINYDFRRTLIICCFCDKRIQM